MKAFSLPPEAGTYSLVLFISFILSLSGCKSTGQGTATLGIINARIWTGNPDQPWAEAIAIKGENILLVGTTLEVQKLMNDSSQVIDASGKMISPGFNDSHVHFIDGGFGLSSVQLRDAKTKEDFIKRIGDFAKTIPAGNWILAGEWDHTNWGGELPKASWIDSITPNHPVFVQRLDGHMGLANSAAMKLSKISSSTKDVEGGFITRESNGSPDGI
ncbi:MAG: amidohydrolase family protein, partial [Phormidesmis sp. FL-bin-119]|nr:amidohydrolase family protein [Pedobacter sp.]